MHVIRFSFPTYSWNKLDALSQFPWKGESRILFLIFCLGSKNTYRGVWVDAKFSLETVQAKFVCVGFSTSSEQITNQITR